MPKKAAYNSDESIMTTSRIRYNQEDGTREGHLVSIMGYSRNNGEVDQADIFLDVSSFLAWKHVQARSGVVLSQLPSLLEGCDFHATMAQYDDTYSAMAAARQLVNATTDPQSVVALVRNTTNSTASNSQKLDWQYPFALLGASHSSTSKPLSILSDVYHLPQISGTATSSDLEDSKFFARTIPTNGGEARAIMTYYKSLGITHVACLFIQDPWGRDYNRDLKVEADRLGITLASIPYTDDGMEDSIKQLKHLQYRYVFAIMFDWRPVLKVAYEYGIVGNEQYSWIAAEVVDWMGLDFELARNDPDSDIFAQALNGIGTLLLHISEHKPFVAALNDFARSEELQREYISMHPPGSNTDYLHDLYGAFPTPSYNPYQALFYDASIALGLAACQTPGLFSGDDFYRTLVNLQFQGTTGNVSFDPTTGTRMKDSVAYMVHNLQLSDNNSNDLAIRFLQREAVLFSNGDIEILHPYIYFDNSTTPPPSLPPVSYHFNLISPGVKVFGLVLAASAMLLSLGFLLWTYFNRNTFVVKASQPIFLYQLCIGTSIMSSAVIAMSFQGKEPTQRLGIACMATPCLISCGFVIAFSALFTKTWRLNKLLSSGRSMRRISVQAIDVIWPFVLFVTINVAMLLGWGLLSPPRYHRIEEDDYDEFGRSLSSHGVCRSDDKQFYFFLVPILLVNFVALATATYQSWKARNAPTEFSESSYLAVSMASLLETFMLGGPILFVVLDNPTAFYLIGSTLLCISTLAILLPVFVPKYLQRHKAPSQRQSVFSNTSVKNNQTSSRFLRSSFNQDLTRGRMSVTRKHSGMLSSDNSHHAGDRRSSHFSGLSIPASDIY